jgi:hypothetical protein
MMDEPTATMVERIQEAFAAGSRPAQILCNLRAEGGQREIADYLRVALWLNPDCISYIYAWLRNGISDERLDQLIGLTLPQPVPTDTMRSV